MDDTFDRKITLCQRSPSSSHLLAQLWRLNKTLNGIRQSSRITHRHEQARNISLDCIPATRYIGRHNRTPARRRLDQDLGKPFTIRRQNDYMRTGEDRRDILAITKTLDRAFTTPTL